VRPEFDEHVNHLYRVLIEEDRNEARERSEDMLGRFETLNDGGRECGLQDSILALLVHSRCHKICRTDVFSPTHECRKQIGSVPRFLTPLRKDHGDSAEDMKSHVRYFITKLFERRLRAALFKSNGTRVKAKWDTER
jgi:hypothetical protein